MIIEFVENGQIMDNDSEANVFINKYTSIFQCVGMIRRGCVDRGKG